MKKIYLAGISVFLIGIIPIQKIFGQVTITAPSLTVSGCTFPTNYSALGNIVLTETGSNNFSSGGTLILTAPANFQFLPTTGQAIFTAPSNPNLVTNTSITSNTITITFTLNNTNRIDVLTISNLQVRGINTATGASNILRLSGAGGTATISGDAPGAGRNHGTLTSTSLIIPVINTQPATTQTVCSGNSVSFSTVTTGASTYQWYKGAILLTNGGNISGASSVTLTLNPVATGDAAANYYVVVSNSCGNITSNNSNLIVNATPSAAISYIGSPFCLNAGIATVTQTGQAGGTYSSTAGLSLNSATGAVTLATSTAGTYTVTYSFSNGICSSSTTTTIVINGLPADKTISSTASSICFNTGTNVTVATSTIGVTYQLRNSADNSTIGSPVAGTGGTINLATGNLSATTTFNVLATTTATGCNTQMVTTRTITVLPDVSVSANYCIVAGKVRLTATGGSAYQWTTGETTQVIDVDVAGSYSVTATNTLGCQVTKSIIVAQELAVNGDFSAGNTGFTTQYNYSPAANGLQTEGTYAVNNNANYNHTFFWGNDHTSGGAGTGNFMIVNGSPASVRPTVWQQTVSVLPNTDYYFSAWALSMNTVGNDAQLRFAVDGNQIGIIDTLQPGATSNAGPFNWSRFYGTWNSGSSTSAVISIVDLQNAASGNDFGLDDISCGTLVSPPLNVSASPTSVCVGTTLNFISEVAGGTSPFTYSWSGPNSFSSIAQNPSIANASSLHDGMYEIAVTDAHGCTNTESITVTVNPLPTISIASTATSVCFNTAGQATSLIYSATTNLPTTYSITWNGTPTNSFAAVTNVALPSSPLSITVPPNTTVGTYTGTITVKNENGCVSNVTNFTIRVNTIPTATLTGTTTVCQNVPAPNITLTGANGTAPYTFTYQINGGSNQTIATTLDNFVTIAAPTNTTGTFSYTLISVQDAASTPCWQAQSGSATVTVNPLPTATVSGTTAVCQNAATTNMTFTGSGGTAPYTFAYNINSGGIQIVTTPSGNSVTVAAPTSAPGTFLYTLISVQDASSTACSQAQGGSAMVTVNSLPTATISGGTFCTSGMTTLSITGQPGGTFIAFPAGLNINSASGLIDLETSTPGSYTVLYSFINSNSCSGSTSSLITIDRQTIGGTLNSNIVCNTLNSATLSLTGSIGAVQRWESSSDGITWTNISNTLSTLNYSNLLQTTYYRALVQNANCATAYSGIARIAIRDVWTGGAGTTDWFTPGNWSENLLPALSCPFVVIPVVPSGLYPTIDTGTAKVNSIIIQTNASVEVSESGALQVAAEIRNLGKLDITRGLIEFNGDTAQVTAGSVFWTRTIKDLKISNANTYGVKVSDITGDTLNITGHLSFGSVSNSILFTGDNITLKSTAVGTANVDEIAVNNGIAVNYITGKVIVERYVPAHRAWRLFTIPVINDTLNINEAWQEGVTNTNLLIANNKNPFPGFGTHVTGIDRTADFAIGYDTGPQNNFSLKIHDRTRKTTPIDGYQGIQHLFPGKGTNNSPINFLQGYMLFIRGDRSIDMNLNTGAIPTPTVLRAKGTLKTGTQAAIPTSDTFNVIGNPFAATLDMRKIERTGGVSEFFYLYDTRLGTIGGFQTFSKNLNGDYVPLPGGGSYSPPYGNPASYNFIQSGQAFFVQSLGAGGVVIKEDSKELPPGSYTYGPVMRTTQLRTNLYAVSTTAAFLDATLNQFTTDGNNAIDGKDAMKLGSIAGGTSMGIAREGKNLIIERRQLLNKFDTIFYNMTTLVKRNYRLELIAEKLDENVVSGIVEDAYLKTSAPLNLTDTTMIDFTVNTDIGSAAPDRFRIVFEGRSTSVIFSLVTARLQKKNVIVEWHVNNEVNIKSYYVEVSVNGLDFVKTSTVEPKGNDFSAENYQWVDENVAPGIYYFRISSLSNNGEVQYSNVVKVIVTRGKSGIKIFPNPVHDKKIKIHFHNQPEGEYAIKLINSLGEVMLTAQIIIDDANSVETLRVNKKIIIGAYRLEITKPDMSIISTNVILQ